MDIVYTLIGFTLVLIGTAIVEIITGGLITGVEATVGIFFYPLLYNIYPSLYNQLPPNATKLQAAVNNSFQNSLTYISQTNTHAAMAINTLAMVLEIIAIIGAFIIILEILMRLGMPRDEDAPTGY